MKNTLTVLSVAYLIFTLLSAGSSLFVEEKNEEKIRTGEPVCYWYDAMVTGVAVENTKWDKGIEFFMNHWLIMLYSPIFMFCSIQAFVTAILAWIPILYLVFIIIKKVRSNHRVDPTRYNAR